MSDINLGIKLRFDGKEVDAGVTISREHLRQFGAEARRAGETTAGSFTSASRGVRSISDQLDQAKNAAIGYFSVTQAYQGARWIVEQASAMQQMEARLKVATASAVEYSRASAGVFEVANRWGAAVEQTAGAFARLNPVVAQMGGNSQITLRMLDGLSASLRLSGATAAETSAVLLQFAQAMGSGRVGGDEFRSMMENAEPLMRAVAQELGKTTGELRQMAEDGKLTSSVFGNALLPAIDKLAEKAAGIPLGVGQAMQVLKNNLLKDFGKEFGDQADLVAKAIKAISDRTPEMAAAVHKAADGLATLAGKAAIVAGGAALGAVVLSAGSAGTALTGMAKAIGAVDAASTLFVTGAALQRLEKLSMAGKAGLVGLALWGGYEAGTMIGKIDGVSEAVSRLLEPVFRAYDRVAGDDLRKKQLAAEDAVKALEALRQRKAAGDTHVAVDTEVLGLSSKKVLGIDDAIAQAETTAKNLQAAYVKIGMAPVAAADETAPKRRLSAAGEYDALTKDFKWREKVLKDYAEKLDKLQASYADKFQETPEGNQGALTRNHQAMLAALMEERKQALEGLPGFKDGKASAEARADAIAKGWHESIKHAIEIIKQDRDQYRLSTDDFINAEGAFKSADIEQQIVALKQKLGAATKDSEKIKIRADISALEEDLKQIPEQTKAALEDAASQSEEAMRRLSVDAGKQLDPLEEKGREFAQKWGETMRRAAANGNEPMLKAGREVWAAWADEAQFKAAKDQYDAMFADMQKQIEAVRETAAQDGGLFAGLAGDEQVKAIRDKMLPQLQALIDKMREAQGTSPVSERTVTEATRATQKAASEISPTWKKLSEDIERGLTDSLYRSFESGKGFGETFFGSLKAMAKSTVLKIAVQGIVQGGMNAVGLGASGTAGSIGGIGNLFSAGNNVYDLFNGGASSAYTNFATSSVGQAIGLGTGLATTGTFGSTVAAGLPAMSAAPGTWAAMYGGTAPAMSVAGTAGTTGLTSLGSMLGTAMPYIAAAIAIYSMFSGKGGGPKTGGDAYLSFSGDNASAMSSQQLATLMPNLGGNTPGVGYFTPDNGNSTVSQAISPAGASVAETIKKLGGSVDGLKLGLGYDTDPAGTASSRVQSGVYRADGSAVYDAMRDVGRDADMAKEMTVELQRMTLGAIKAASGIPQIFKNVVDGIDLAKASAEQMAAAMTQITNTQTLVDFVKLDPFEQWRQGQETASEGMMGVWAKQENAARKLIETFDGSATSTASLAASVTALAQAEAQVVAYLNQAIAATRASTASDAESMYLSTLDNQGQYQYRMALSSRYEDAMATATTPEEVIALNGQLRGNYQAAWGLLSPEQQRQYGAQFFGSLDQSTGQFTGGYLGDLQSDTEASLAPFGDAIAESHDPLSSDSLVSQLSDVLGILPDKMQAVVDDFAAVMGRFEAAAAAMEVAANTPVEANVTVFATVAPGVEVNA